MTLGLPEKRLYHYELSRRETRLVLCLTGAEIREFLKRKGVKKKLGWHFRDGHDLEVSAAEFDYLKEVYGLDLGLDAEALWMAFRAWREQLARRGAKPGARGFIDAEVLEKMAGLAERFHGPELRAPAPVGTPEERRFEQMARQTRLRELAVKLPVETVLAKEELDALTQRAPPLSKGERPLAVFARMQRAPRRVRKGGK